MSHNFNAPQATVEAGGYAIKALMALCGASSATLLALAANQPALAYSLITSIGFFAGSMFCSVLCFGLRYMAQAIISDEWKTIFPTLSPTPFVVFAIMFWIIGLLAWSYAMFEVMDAMRHFSTLIN